MKIVTKNSKTYLVTSRREISSLFKKAQPIPPSPVPDNAGLGQEDKVRLDWEDLEKMLGTPYDYSLDATSTILTLTMSHVDSIVSGHGPKGAYMRGVVANLKALQHVVSASARGSVITVEFDVPVEII